MRNNQTWALFKPDANRGQNFLIDESGKIVSKMVKGADISKNDIVLEIGPGFGVLTKAIAPLAKQVFTVEIDKRLISVLNKEFIGYKNITLINKDIRDVLDGDNINFMLGLKGFDYKVVANLPYNLTSFIIRSLLESLYKPSMIVFMVQKEVAERIVSKPGDMSILAVSVQYYGNAVMVIDSVSKDMFLPAPKVDSAVIKIVPYRNLIVSKNFFKLVKIGFSAPRKQLQNNLTNGLHIAQSEIKKILQECDLPLMCRAQDLSVIDWKKICMKLDEKN